MGTTLTTFPRGPLLLGARVFVTRGSHSEGLPCRTGTVVLSGGDGGKVLHDDGFVFGWSSAECRSLTGLASFEGRIHGLWIRLTLWARTWLNA